MSTNLKEHRQAMQDVNDAELRIAQQRKRIIQLFVDRQDISEAAGVLKIMENSLTLLIEHRDALAAKLGYGSYHP